MGTFFKKPKEDKFNEFPLGFTSLRVIKKIKFTPTANPFKTNNKKIYEHLFRHKNFYFLN